MVITHRKFKQLLILLYLEGVISYDKRADIRKGGKDKDKDLFSIIQKYATLHYKIHPL